MRTKTIASRGSKKERNPDDATKIKTKMRCKLLSFVLYMVVSSLFGGPQCRTLSVSWGPAFNNGKDVRKINLTSYAYRFVFDFSIVRYLGKGGYKPWYAWTSPVFCYLGVKMALSHYAPRRPWYIR